MPPEPIVRVTLDVTCDSETVVEKWATDFLVGRGFNVSAPHGKWERIGDFKNRLGICYETLTRKLKDLPHRPNVVVQRGGSGRLLAILSNPDFDAFCVANK